MALLSERITAREITDAATLAADYWERRLDHRVKFTEGQLAGITVDLIAKFQGRVNDELGRDDLCEALAVRLQKIIDEQPLKVSA